MSNIDIAKARQLIAEASPAPWCVNRSWDGQSFVERVDDGDGVLIGDAYGHGSPVAHTFDMGTSGRDVANASFIAYARDALPAALDRIEQLQAALDEACTLADRWIDLGRDLDIDGCHRDDIIADELRALAAGEVTP